MQSVYVHSIFHRYVGNSRDCGGRNDGRHRSRGGTDSGRIDGETDRLLGVRYGIRCRAAWAFRVAEIRIHVSAVTQCTVGAIGVTPNVGAASRVWAYISFALEGFKEIEHDSVRRKDRERVVSIPDRLYRSASIVENGNVNRVGELIIIQLLIDLSLGGHCV